MWDLLVLELTLDTLAIVRSFSTHVRSSSSQFDPLTLMLDPLALMLDPLAFMWDHLSLMLDPLTLMWDLLALMWDLLALMFDPSSMHVRSSSMHFNPLALILDPLALMLDPLVHMLDPLAIRCLFIISFFSGCLCCGAGSPHIPYYTADSNIDGWWQFRWCPVLCHTSMEQSPWTTSLEWCCQPSILLLISLCRGTDCSLKLQ